MKKTVMITGSSSGIGRETALYFSEKGWNVLATMRNPKSRDHGLNNKPNIEIIPLDVTDKKSIRDAVKYTIETYGRIDTIVNNAGYAVFGPFEAATEEQIRKQFETNLFGLMAVTREVIPRMRERGDGTIIMVSSVGGMAAVAPFLSLYYSTKWAVEGLSESLYFELKPFNIRVKIVEPGLARTNFHNSMDFVKCNIPQYENLLEKRIKRIGKYTWGSSHPRDVAKTIFRAANDKNWRLRYPVGIDTTLLLLMRRVLPERVFIRLVELLSYHS
ncbi:MAG: SDR family oxidoreductase [Candidatus Micrarchaeia archaeon]